MHSGSVVVMAMVSAFLIFGGCIGVEDDRDEELNIGYLGAAPAVLVHVNTRTPTKIIGQVNNEGSALVVSQDIKEADDLIGKTIAIPTYGSVQSYLFQMFCRQNDLDFSKIHINSEIKAPDMLVTMESGKIDGFIAWEPFPSEAVSKGYKELFSSNDVWPDHPCCCIVVNEKFLEEEPELVDRFLKAHSESTDYINRVLKDKGSGEYEQLVDIAVNFTQRDETVVRRALDNIIYIADVTPEFRKGIAEYTDNLISLGIIDEGDLKALYQSPAHLSEEYIEGLDYGSIQQSSDILGKVYVGYLIGDLHQLAYPVGRELGIFEKYGVEVLPAPGAPYIAGSIEMQQFR